MDRRSFGVAFGMLVTSACATRITQPMPPPSQPRTTRSDLVFVTRDECVNTPDMFINLDDALRALGLPLDYQVVNLGKLPRTDPRTGYPTPTVLYQNRDIFGMPPPTPPFPEPS
jgi:hypothetical protein